MRPSLRLAGITVVVGTAVGLAPSVTSAQPLASAQEPAVPTTGTSFEQLSVGSSGPRVVQVQTALRSLGHSLAVDGQFGPVTLSRVRAFQASRGLRIDGIVGPITWGALGLNGSAAPATPATPAPPAAGALEHLRVGATGQRVVQVQTALRSLGYPLAVDGQFGPVTLSRVRAFQASRGLRIDGIVGPITWGALGLNGSTAPATPAPSTPSAPPAGSYVHPNSDVERWHDDAVAAGWPESDWRRLSCIIQRESGGVAAAKNPSSAIGLLQITWSVHGSWIGGSSSQLLDGPTNLRIGRQLYTRAGGWSPWSSAEASC